MSSLATIKNELNAIISKANQTSGKADTTVNAAVNTLIQGYGTGGSGGSGIVPSGSVLITQNGIYNVTEKATVIVNVPTNNSESYCVLPLTLSQLGGTAATNNVILSGNSFVKAHYADEGFFAILLPLDAANSAQPAATTSFIYAGNRPIANSRSVVYGVRTIGAGSSSYATAQNATAKISGTGYNIALRAASNGNISIYVAANLAVPAGNYLLVLGLANPLS